jgi:hypothetical protein
LKPHPNIGLYGFEQITEMDVPIGVWQCGGDENLTLGHVKLGCAAGVFVRTRSL